jgi:hypothetical protein
MLVVKSECGSSVRTVQSKYASSVRTVMSECGSNVRTIQSEYASSI